MAEEELLPDVFPWRTRNETYLGAALPEHLTGSEPGLWTGLYGQVCDPMAKLVPEGPQLKTETLPGRRVESGVHPLVVPAGSVLPVMALAPSDLRLTGSLVGAIPLPPRRWRHLRFEEPFSGHAHITAPVVFGASLSRGEQPQASPLVLMIFIDGLSQVVLKDAGEPGLMPQTSSFFEQGLRFSNCYATAEWTLTNVASALTGLYASRHNMFHPRRPMALPPEPLISERMRSVGYTTVSVGANWRATPAYGYARGFDRTIYQKNLPGAQVVSDLIDQLTSLGDRAVFAYASFMDIHWKCEDSLPDITVQTAKPLGPQLREPLPDSLMPMYQGGYDLENITAYEPQIRKLDRTLGVLFDYLTTHYADFTVLLFSDHGQSFNSRFTHSWELSDVRLRVPLMVRGPGVPVGRPEEFVELVDIPNILFAAAELSSADWKIDGRLPACLGGTARPYVYSETRYPGRLFRAAITERDKKYLMCSVGKVDDAGYFELGQAHRLAYQLGSEEGQIHELPWDERYTQVIVERAGTWIKETH
ncbi:sulfatase-like hydrolase/transferase [Sphaerisporangium fuscum]|uniref:sulfatase-like hydrolase/transferase n=1 Tax=Sphaerisporangium fuscum TaxID=2835868 RepID=UPI001BDC1282|nr:sulfatase-like hydrolase/transferase [Sphaerisporangium fuscum]